MKVTYETKNARLAVEIESDKVKDVFKQLAEFQEIFDEEKCGSCKSENIKFQVRNVEGNDFFEMKCDDCGAKLAFGQYKTGGGLFPKRKKEDGTYDRVTRGWRKWVPEPSAEAKATKK